MVFCCRLREVHRPFHIAPTLVVLSIAIDGRQDPSSNEDSCLGG